MSCSATQSLIWLNCNKCFIIMLYDTNPPQLGSIKSQVVIHKINKRLYNQALTWLVIYRLLQCCIDMILTSIELKSVSSNMWSRNEKLKFSIIFADDCCTVGCIAVAEAIVVKENNYHQKSDLWNKFMRDCVTETYHKSCKTCLHSTHRCNRVFISPFVK